MAKITDIMIPVSFKAHKNATVREVIRQLVDGHIGWVPIVDDDNKLLTYITDGDIVRYVSNKRPRFFDYGEIIAIDVDDQSYLDKFKGLLDTPAINIANKKHNIFAEVDQDIEEVADIFRREQVRLVAVLDKGRVVGVVREGDIVRHILLTLLPD